jgi:dipeptidase
VWSFFNKWAAEDMKPYMPYAMGEDVDPETKQPIEGVPHEMPLWVKSKKLLSTQDVKDMMRDHYEGTPMDITEGLGGLPWQMPYRVTPLSYKVDGKEYFNERPISTVQSSAIYVAQMRDYLPDYIGGVLWFGNDDANMVALTPIYSCLEAVPECYSQKLADATTFSFRNAYWMCNWVSNMVYYRYNLLFPELQTVRDRLEKDFNSVQALMESKAKEMGEAEGKKFLSDYSLRMSGMMMDEWMQLAQRIIVKYNDMCVKKVDENGDYILTPGGEPVAPQRPGYPQHYLRKMVEESGEKYLVK